MLVSYETMWLLFKRGVAWFVRSRAKLQKNDNTIIETRVQCCHVKEQTLFYFIFITTYLPGHKGYTTIIIVIVNICRVIPCGASESGRGSTRLNYWAWQRFAQDG